MEPPPSQWRFPPARSADENGVVGLGADLEPGTVLEGYRNGIFPMPVDDGRLLAWWSPDPRGVLPLDGLKVSRSLRRSQQRFVVTFDTAFDDVLDACASPDRDGRWIDEAIAIAYGELHRLGWAHSVEVRDPADGRLVGGLYGIHIDGLFAGESMFHTERDASKVALVALVERLRAIGAVLLDVQWLTPHLASLGAVAISRDEYLERLAVALATPAGPIALDRRP